MVLPEVAAVQRRPSNLVHSSLAHPSLRHVAFRLSTEFVSNSEWQRHFYRRICLFPGPQMAAATILLTDSSMWISIFGLVLGHIGEAAGNAPTQATFPKRATTDTRGTYYKRRCIAVTVTVTVSGWDICAIQKAFDF